MIGKAVFKQCSQCDCGEERFIVNKTHNLCEEKNRERLDGNRQGNVKKKKALLAKSVLSTKGKGLSVGKKKLKLSTAKSQTNKSYKQVCEQIADERGLQCEGCGTYDRLSFSHLSPRSRRPDLIDNPKNIHIHCMDGDGVVGCHTKYEAGHWSELNDKTSIEMSLQEIDPEYLRIKQAKQ